MIPLITCLLLFLVPQSGAAVSGIVVDRITRAPIAGAHVLLARIDGPLTQSVAAETGDDGRFEFKSVPEGQYRWFVDAPGYVRSEFAPGGVRPETSRSLGPGAVYTGAILQIRLDLTPTAVIAGRVVSDHGDPAPKIAVRAWSAGKVVAEAQTNDLGEYRLFDLAAGSYTVSAERYQGPRVEGAVLIIPTPPCPDCPGEGAGRQSLAQLMAQGAFVDPRVVAGRTYPPVYFPATLDRAAAAAIDLAPGQVVVGIEMRLILKAS